MINYVEKAKMFSVPLTAEIQGPKEGVKKCDTHSICTLKA